MSDFLDERWEQGVEHYPESIALIKLVNDLDTTLALDLKCGGDGDVGETLAYFLDELIDRKIISITINKENA